MTRTKSNTNGAMESESVFGQTLRQHRRRRDFTQAALAHEVGCATVTIQRIEQGTLRPSRQIAERLAVIFDLSGGERERFVRHARGGDDGQAERRVAAGATPAPEAGMRGLLPAPLTPLIGRAHEVATVCHLLTEEGVRWLTLTGPGGIGKTRVALQAAAELSSSFADGVVFIDLAPIKDAALVPAAIARTLGLPQLERQRLVWQLQTALREQQMLLVLDNFEQVTPAAPIVAALLQAVPGLKVLITSRVVAGVSGEYLVDVPPLACPPPASFQPWAQLVEYDAVRLFAERARALRPGVLAHEELAAVAAICAQLDGLPLAIELAAARTALFPPQALLARLDRRLPLLTTGACDLPPRQQTLRDTIAWSYDLLEPPLRTLFARLAVFVGGWTLEAAEAVCDTEGELGLDIIDGLAVLVNQSLVRREPAPAGETRFTMLATIQEYALERLVESGEIDRLRWQHAWYYLDLARTLAPGLLGGEQAHWLARLDVERDNLQAVWAWGQAGYPGEPEPGSGTTVVLGLAGALWHYWLLRGSTADWLRWLPAELGEILPGTERLPPAVRASLWAWALLGPAALSLYLGDYPATCALASRCAGLFEAAEVPWGKAAAQALLGAATAYAHPTAGGRSILAESLQLARAQGDPWLTAWCLLHAGFELLYGDGGPAHPDQAQMLLEESLALAQRAGDPWLIAWTLNHLGRSALVQRELVQAAALFEATLAFRRQAHDPVGVAWSLGQLGLVAHEMRDYGRALALNEERYGVEQQMGNLLGMSAVRYSQAAALAALCRYEHAVRAASDGVELVRQTNDGRRTGWYVLLQGQIARQAGIFAQAHSCCEECFAIARATGDWKLGAWARHTLGYAALDQAEVQHAAECFRASLACFGEHHELQGVAACLAGLAATCHAAGDAVAAVGLLCATERVLRTATVRLEHADQRAYEHTLAGVRAYLGETAFAAAWAAGQARGLDEVVAAALGGAPSD
jgi:predicted ATPase/DNA-binding XRE family transcriptional regulator/tetratricopeptide (TPR) repeat protein